MSRDHKTQEQNNQAHNRFRNALSAGQAAPLDRFGFPIEVGAKVLYRPPMDLVFTVASIKPILDPRQPAGQMDVTLQVSFPLRLPANQINPNAVLMLGLMAREAGAIQREAEVTQETTGEPSDKVVAMPTRSQADGHAEDEPGDVVDSAITS